MAFEIPDTMEKCIYFTRRTLENDGRLIAWVERMPCPKCKKGTMGKPREKGKVKIRSSIYECPECNYQEDKKTHEESCEVKVIYTCPYCKHKGETTTPYKRKKLDGVDSYIFECQGCKKKIGITKKMKEKKEK